MTENTERALAERKFQLYLKDDSIPLIDLSGSGSITVDSCLYVLWERKLHKFSRSWG